MPRSAGMRIGGRRVMRILIWVPIFGTLVAGAAAAQTPDEHWARCEASGLRLDSDQIASCTAVIESGQGTTHDLAKAFRHRGSRYAFNRDYVRAIGDYIEAIRLDPNYRAFDLRAHAYADLGDFDRAIDDYTQAIMLRPDLWRAFYRRGLIYAAKGDSNLAIQDYSRAISLNDNFNRMWIFFSRGEARRAAGDIDRAIADYEMTLRISPSYRCAWYRRGLAYREKGDEERALQDFGRAARLHNELVRAYPNSARRYSSPDRCTPDQP